MDGLQTPESASTAQVSSIARGSHSVDPDVSQNESPPTRRRRHVRSTTTTTTTAPSPSTASTRQDAYEPASAVTQAAPRRLVCSECRARKVRCDRDAARCGPCVRFQLDCSYSTVQAAGTAGDAHSPGSEARDNSNLTQAGLARRRIRRACNACRNLKARCSGNKPCLRCQSQRMPCVYPPRPTIDVLSMNTCAYDNSMSVSEPDLRLSDVLPTTSVSQSAAVRSVQGSRLDSSPIPSLFQSNAESRDQRGAEVSRDISSTPPLDHVSKALTENSFQTLQDLETFFDKPAGGPICIQFLHRSSVLADWSQDRLEPVLVATLCALGRIAAKEQSSYCRGLEDGCSRDNDIDTQDARTWLDEVRHVLVRDFGTATFAKLKTLILVIQYRVALGDVMDAWNLVALAARMAFTLRLNYELTGCHHDPVYRETRRRMMWTVWLIDRLLAGGIEDLVVCPTERMHIRLPCDDHTFQRGITSRAEWLTDSAPQIDADLGTMGYYLRLLDCRHRILRYTKRVIREAALPISSCDELMSLQSDLIDLEKSLPNDLKLTPEHLRLKAHSHDAGDYIALHLLWNQCHCDLYRFLVPGMREAVGDDIFKSTPTEYVLRCQTACLLAAVRAAELLAQLHGLGLRKAQNIPNLTVGVYQISQIIYRLQHLLSSCGNGLHDASTIQHVIHDAREMVSILQPKGRRGPKAADILAETDNFIEKIGRHEAMQQSINSNGSPAMMNTQSDSSNDAWPGMAQHLASRGSYLDDMERQTDMGRQADPRPRHDTVSRVHNDDSVSNTRSEERLQAQGCIGNERASLEMQASQSLVSLQHGVVNAASGVIAAGVPDVWASSNGRLSGYRQQLNTEMSIPWDPFEVQLYDFHDPNLETVLHSLSGP